MCRRTRLALTHCSITELPTHQIGTLPNHVLSINSQVDPLMLPDMPHYQPRRGPGAVGRSDVLSAITAAQRWEEVAAIVDNR